ncbi:hypothetical protein [Peribacillus simplex]
MGSIIQTLFHLVDVERSWIRLFQEKKTSLRVLKITRVWIK